MPDKQASERLERKEYEKELRKLQVQLCYLQDWIKESGQRAIIVLEGRDAAGKGGTIKAITKRVSPRVFRVVALPAPTDREKSQMYIQRYLERFPAAGEIVIFDRSWYNRAGVELVMGNAFVRNRNSRLMQAVRSAPDAAAGLALVRQAMEPRVGSHGLTEDREQLYRSLRSIVAHAGTKPGMVTADDIRSAIAVFVLVVAAALPSAVPFLLIGDAQLALRVANVVQVALLFVVGFYWARSVGGNGWGAGLVAMLSGTLLVVIAIVLGG